LVLIKEETQNHNTRPQFQLKKVAQKEKLLREHILSSASSVKEAENGKLNYATIEVKKKK